MQALNLKQADTLIDELSDGGHEADVKEAVRRFRHNPTADGEELALTGLRSLPEERQRELRCIARL